MSSMKKSSCGKESHYSMDPKLIPRVRQYLASHANLKNFSVGTMAKELQIMYGDYARKKRIAFLKCVEKAYQVICNEEEHSSEEAEDFTSQLEQKHLSNKSSNYRYNEDCIDIESDTTDKSFSSDNTDYIPYKDNNMMNNFMTSLYQGHSKKTPQTDKSNSFMEVPTHLNTVGSVASSTPVHKPVLLLSPSTPGVSYPHLQNGLHYTATVTPTLQQGQQYSNKQQPQQQEQESAVRGPSPSTYQLTSPPLLMSSHEVRSNSIPQALKTSHLYSVDTALSHKERTPLLPKGDRKSTDTPTSYSMNKSSERKKKILVGTPEHSSFMKTPKGDSHPSSAKRLRSMDKSRVGNLENLPKSKSSEPDFQISTVTFADVGGNENCLKEICKILIHMKHPEIHRQLGINPPRGILLHGPPGCGKTLLADAIAGELQLPFLKVAATELVSGVSGESEQKMRQLFEKARLKAPCVLFLDEVDVITPKRETASKDMERRIVAQLLICLDDLNNEKKAPANVMVIGATNRPDSLDPALRRAGRFDREICMGIPDKNARQRILQILCKSLSLSMNFDFAHLAHVTPGFVGADLGALAREAAMVAIDRVFKALEEVKRAKMEVNKKIDDKVEADSNTSEEVVSMETSKDGASQMKPSTECVMSPELILALSWLRNQPPLSLTDLENMHITMEDFLEALKVVQPSAKREGFATIPDVTWDDIGALHDIREELKLAILAPVKYPERFKSLGLTRAPGIMLAGPPGCGKTLLAKAIANESGINFISVKGPELLNMYVGESERAVRQVFQRARNSSPCVIFFDELDSLCPRRPDGGEGGATVRVVNQMLTEMDGLEERKQVFIMAATNRLDIIDPAILRPGRMDKILYVSLPTPSDRLDILRTITKNGTKPKLADESLIEFIAKDERCNGFSGADLTSLISEASVNALKESIADHPEQPPEQVSVITVTNKHLELALNKVKPSITTKEYEKYEKMRSRLKS